MPLKQLARLLASAALACAMAGCQGNQTTWLRRTWEDFRYDRGWISRRQAVQWVISEDPDLRQKGISILNRKGYQGLPKTEEYVRTMADFRAERSAVVRGAAIRAQARAADDPEAVETLIGVLIDRDPYVRAEACVVLGELGEKQAIDPLIDALRADSSSDVRAAAADALGAFHEKKAALALAEFVGDEDFLVAYCCLEGLRENTGEDHGYSSKQWTDWINASEDPFANAGRKPAGPVKPEDQRGYRLKKWLLFWRTDPRERVE